VGELEEQSASGARAEKDGNWRKVDGFAKSINKTKQDNRREEESEEQPMNLMRR
jgi:hypothetical protein